MVGMENAIARNTTELEQLEGVIERGLSTFYEVGRALMRIRDEQLYEKVRGFATFESYCKERWGFERRRAYQFIDAAMVSDNVKNFTQYQIKESHTIPLAKLNNNPEAQRTAWQKAVETAPEGSSYPGNRKMVEFHLGHLKKTETDLQEAKEQQKKAVEKYEAIYLTPQEKAVRKGLTVIMGGLCENV